MSLVPTDVKRVRAPMVVGMLEMPTMELAPEAAAPGAPRGNVMAGGLGALLASFGVVSTSERDEVSDAVEAELAARGHRARVTKLRYATLHLEAGAQEARFLRYDVANILEALAGKVPGQVDRITVHVAR